MSLIWLDISAKVSIVVLNMRLNLDAKLYTISQINDTTLLEMNSIYQMLMAYGHKPEPIGQHNELKLFNI